MRRAEPPASHTRGRPVCTTNRAVNPGLIFYDMHAVLRDIDRAAAAEERRAPAGERREAAGSGA